MVKDRDLYGALAFAETAESLRLNIEAMQVGSDDRVVGITASGDLLISLLAAGPKAVVGFDANDAQTALSHLKVAAILSLSVEDYKGFMGVQNMPSATRLNVLNRVSRSLPSIARREVLAMSELVGRGILDNGMSHLIVQLAASIARIVLSENTFALFLGERGTDQDRFDKLQEIKNRRRIRYVLRPMLKALAPRLKWLLFPHRFCDISSRPEEIIHDFFTVFEDLLVQGMQANPVLCRAAVGRPHPEWSEHLYNEHTFTRIRNNVSNLSLRTAEFICGLKQISDKWATRIYLSNMPDYLSEEQLAELVSEVRRTAAPGARIVYCSLYDKDLLQDLGAKIPAAELRALHDSDNVFIYPTIMVRTSN